MKRLWIPAALIGSTYLMGCASSPSTPPHFVGDHGLKMSAELASMSSSRQAAFDPEALIRKAPTAAAAPTSLKKLSVQTEAVAIPLDDGNPREAIGTPLDPLRPDAPVNLSDLTANQDLRPYRLGYALPELQLTLVTDHEQLRRPGLRPAHDSASQSLPVPRC